jgi:hypothetical protein
MEQTRDLIGRAEAEIRGRYPAVSLAETHPAEAGMLRIRADRDGRVA